MLAFLLTLTAGWLNVSQAFCGFYVARADTRLFNQASQVVLARDGERTVVTMANDFSGDVKDFAIVVPVPTFLERGQINVAERSAIEHLDAYTAPRLVEYFDPDPCRQSADEMMRLDAAPAAVKQQRSAAGMRGQGVTIEASYTVGEYDILILSATQSDSLVRWLKDNGYRIPAGAERVVGSYLKQDMRFFVARVNLAEQSKLGFSYLRPIQIAYESPKFMLPIRLGTLNAQGAQELYVYALTRTGRVETTNYRTVRLPSDQNVPVSVKENFGEFYRAMFAQQTRKESNRAVFLEYAWDMGWCDPCAADPLTPGELKRLGVFWLDERESGNPQAQNVFVTRLHVRYDAKHFPEDLVFHETGDRSNFQGRYVVRHAWTGAARCAAAQSYRASLTERWDTEAMNLAALTGWDINTIRADMQLPAQDQPVPWWQRLWNN
jgi:hypothetical protein